MNKPSLAEVQEFFFRGMIGGWAAGGGIFTMPGMPGYEGIVLEEEHFRLLDLWLTTPLSTKSFGTTTIWWREAAESVWIPVWFMQYGGWYEEEAIPLVQAALSETYAKSEFHGCRGPGYVLSDDLVYMNTPRLSGFGRFEGQEEVRRYSSNELLGVHEYSGMSLL